MLRPGRALIVLYVCLYAALVLLGPAQAKTWDEAIRDVETLAETYERQAKRLLDEIEPRAGSPISYAFGNSAAFIDTDEHLCAILGRRLGRVEYIRHLEPPQPALSSDFELMARTAASLNNWVRSARRFSDMSQAERAQYWNLQCVGQHGIAATLADGRSRGEVFYSVNGTYLIVYGDVVTGYAERLRAALDANPGTTFIGLGSAGGNVTEAIKAGIEIRERGLKTQIWGPCLSACPLVFLGGVERFSLRGYPPLGFHTPYVLAEGAGDGAGRPIPVPLDSPIYTLLAGYIAAMGADPAWVIAQMQSAGAYDMVMFGATRAEREALCRARVVTFTQGGGAITC